MSSATKIFFTGAQGVGKSTQADYFARQYPEFSVLKTRRREFFNSGIININQKASPMDEAIIMGDLLLAMATTPSPFISERSFVDKCAYTQCLPLKKEILDAYHVINTEAFPGLAENDFYFYFAPVLPLEDDGVRSLDPAYQKEVDFYIQFYLNYFQIPFISIEAYTVQDRHMEICKSLGLL